MATTITVRILLGGLVHVEIDGTDAKEISEALEGWEEMNERIDNAACDLAKRVYAEGGVQNGGDKAAGQAKET
ncbi:MAG: hypothetical protein GY947_05275 [Rhodobacteraceae bacterium]|nr:hypothetical protein [Paracoccaceae bacterium]